MQKIVLLIILCAACLSAGELQTFTYLKNDSLDLQLDLFLPENAESESTPLVIYVHGGGFSNGDRAGGHKLAKYLNSHNIACASITYTLYMKGKSFSCDGILAEKVRAIQIAANQTWQATAFLIEHSDKFKIDKSQIFLAGSSAGAETVLHAAYWNKDSMQLYDNRLPLDFTFAGLIAGAGAIMDLNLITPENQIPMMVFHGDADPTVPYGTAAHHYCPHNASGWLMLFGSHSIAKHVEKLGGTCQLDTFLGGKHSFAGAYFYQNQQPVVYFIERVLAGEQFIIFNFIKPDSN